MERAIVGWIVRARGLKGEIVVKPTTREPQRLKRLLNMTVEVGEDNSANMYVENIRLASGNVLIKFSGIDSRTSAEQFQGQAIMIPGDDLPKLNPDEYYIHDVEGLTVKDPCGNVMGRIIQVLEYPANDVFVMSRDKEEVWIPATRDIVKRVDLSEKTIVMELPEGLPVYKSEKR